MKLALQNYNKFDTIIVLLKIYLREEIGLVVIKLMSYLFLIII